MAGRRSRVHDLLDPAALAALEDFARDRRHTVKDCFAFLARGGFDVSLSSVTRWHRKFLVAERFRMSNDTARAVMEAAKAGGVAAIGDAAALQLAQLIFEVSLSIQEGDAVDGKKLMRLTAALRNVVSSKAGIEELKRQIAETITKSEAAKRPPAEIIAEVRAIVFGPQLAAV
jgi:hypothetical protein